MFPLLLQMDNKRAVSKKKYYLLKTFMSELQQRRLLDVNIGQGKNETKKLQSDN